jgi:hypothetical protein
MKEHTQIWIILKFTLEFFSKILLKNVQKKFQVHLGRNWRAEILNKHADYECFKALLSDFEVLDICCGFLEKIGDQEVQIHKFKIWQILDFFFKFAFLSFYDIHKPFFVFDLALAYICVFYTIWPFRCRHISAVPNDQPSHIWPRSKGLGL